MLQGLEISEVTLEYVHSNNGIFRIDSSYFKKEYLKEENEVRNSNFDTLGKLTSSIKSFGAYSLNNQVTYVEQGIPFIRGVNMKDGRINFNNMIYIPNDAHKLLWKSEVKPQTVLLSMSGTLGEVAIASKKWNYPVNSNQDIAKIHTNKNINPHFLYIFLLSKYGQNYVKREARGSVQQHVFLSQIKNFEIPLLADKFQQLLEQIVLKSQSLIQDSNAVFELSKENLFNALRFDNFTNPDQKTNIKTFAVSSLGDQRLDAEYYQPRYDELEKIIHHYINGFGEINQVCDVKSDKFYPEDKSTYKYIELSNIGASGEITGYTEALGEDLPTRARRKVERGDVIISSIEGSLESCAIVTEKYDGALCSTGFYVLRSDKINSETLLVLFKSELMQELLARNCTGTILTSLNKTDFEVIEIPIIEHTVQQEIKDKVQESFILREESKSLLKTAKRAVEIAIEQDEEAAIDFIAAEKS